VCSVLLAGAATILKPRQDENEKLDMKKNILISAGITPEQGDTFTRAEINSVYEKNITGFVVNNSGQVVEGKVPADLDPKKDKELLPLFKYVKDGQLNAFILPVSGKGLWSTIYGYMALSPDFESVMGVTFYKHGETPGLGGEISKEWFTDNFKGKKIFDAEGKLVSINVAKGKYSGAQPEHNVDGISGSTLTGRGVANFLKTELEKYNPFFASVRSQEGGSE
jgi:Na+-transporting NADH:ubiquinone oxidoreductase subunit C